MAVRQRVAPVEKDASSVRRSIVRKLGQDGNDRTNSDESALGHNGYSNNRDGTSMGANSSSVFLPQQPCVPFKVESDNNNKSSNDTGPMPQVFIYIMVSLAGLFLLSVVLKWTMDKRDAYLRRIKPDEKLEARKTFIKKALIVKPWEGEEVIQDDATIGSDQETPSDGCRGCDESCPNSSASGTSDDPSHAGCSSLSEKYKSVNATAVLEEDDNELEKPSCAICLGVLHKGQFICESPNKTCTHIFHESCMTGWLERQTNCPICRQTYLPEKHGKGNPHQNSIVRDLLVSTQEATTAAAAVAEEV